MKINEKKLLIDTIANGVDRGFDKAFLVHENPKKLDYKSHILNEIVKELDRYFQFDEIESMREKYPANVEGSANFNRANFVGKETNHIPTIDRRISGC